MTSRILIVDDDADVLGVLREQLGAEGYESEAATRVDDALRRLEDEKFAVIISDQRMPEMTGLEFLARAKLIQPDASRILLTGVLSLDTMIDAINHGELFRFIAKPWARAELIATVSNAIGRFHLTQSNARLLADTAKLNAELERTNAELRKKVGELIAQKGALDAAHSSLRANFERSLELSSRIINTFYPLIGQHTKTVVEICRLMAETAHFSEEEKHVLTTSARLHDIGLIAHQRDLVRKFYTVPDSLTAKEIEQLKTHPEQGQMLASFIDQLTSVGEVIRAHHEHFDGSGYPDRLRGESIPWPARCLAVAVFYVECGLANDDAADALLKGSGTRFDPEAVRLFFKATRAAELPRQLREILLSELEPGMRLAKPVYIASGLLLYPQDKVLNDATIAKLRNHELQTSVTQRMLVYR